MNYTFGDRVKKLIEISSIGKGEKDAILSLGRITFQEVRDAHQTCKNDPDVKSLMCYISDLSPVFQIYDETKVSKGNKTEEYKSLMQRLRSEEKEKEYRKLLKRGTESVGVDSIGGYAFMSGPNEEMHRVENVNQTAKEVKHQLTTIVNILITVVSAGYAVWYWSGSSMGLSRADSIGGNMGIRVMLSLFAAIVVLIAEVVVFGGYLRKVDEARTKGKALEEERSVVQTIVIKGKGHGNGMVKRGVKQKNGNKRKTL